MLPEDYDSDDNHLEAVRKLKKKVNNPLNGFLAAHGMQWFDGVLLYSAAKSGIAAAVTAIELPLAGHPVAVKEALEAYITWFEKTYKPTHNVSGKGAWINEQMEYQFAVRCQKKKSPTPF